MRGRHGGGILIVAETGDLAALQGEDHGPVVLGDQARLPDTLPLVAQDDDLITLGDVLLRLEDLELARLAEGPEELGYLIAAAPCARVRDFGRAGEPPFDVLG